MISFDKSNTVCVCYKCVAHKHIDQCNIWSATWHWFTWHWFFHLHTSFTTNPVPTLVHVTLVLPLDTLHIQHSDVGILYSNAYKQTNPQISVCSSMHYPIYWVTYVLIIHQVHGGDDIIYGILLVLCKLYLVQWRKHKMSDVLHKGQHCQHQALHKEEVSCHLVVGGSLNYKI